MGDTSLFLSQCVDAAVATYLLTATPAEGTVYEQDLVPFTAPSEGERGDGRQRGHEPRFLAGLIPDMVVSAIRPTS
jgi:hypothetical protein